MNLSVSGLVTERVVGMNRKKKKTKWAPPPPDPVHLHRQRGGGQPAHPGVLRAEEGGVPGHPPHHPGGRDDQVQARQRAHQRREHHRLLHALHRGKAPGETTFPLHPPSPSVRLARRSLNAPGQTSLWCSLGVSRRKGVPVVLPIRRNILFIYIYHWH